jgi:hypothetical protein
MEILHAMNGRQADSKDNYTLQLQKKTKHMTPTVKMDRSA